MVEPSILPSLAQDYLERFDANLVNTAEQPLPEADASVDILGLLDRIFCNGLPGFVVRSASMDNLGVGSAREVEQLIIDTLPKVSFPDEDAPSDWQRIGHRGAIAAVLEISEGDMHHDDIHADAYKVRVHHTTKGSGKVILANSGTGYSLHPNSNDHPRWRDKWALSLFGVGQVDPEMINPHLYSADIYAGDFVIFPLTLIDSYRSEIVGPIWHCFTTTEAPRQADVTDIGAAIEE